MTSRKKQPRPREPYHAEDPVPVDEVHVGTRVRVPVWQAGEVTGWANGTVIERRVVPGSAEPPNDVASIVRLDGTGVDALYYPYSIGRPKYAAAPSHTDGITAAKSIAAAFGLTLGDLRLFASHHLSLTHTDLDEIGSSDVSIHLSHLGLHEPEVLRQEAERLHERNKLVRDVAARTGRSQQTTLRNLQRLLTPREED
jgi:hypothetical protein